MTISTALDNSWKPQKLGKYFRVKHGYAFKGQFFSDSGPYIVVTPGNFFDEGGFKRILGKEKYYKGDFDHNYILKKGDLIIAMTEQAEGLLGSSALVPQDDLYLHNQRIGLIETLDKTQINKKFLYYLFNTTHVRQQIRATASGLKVRHTAPSRIYEVEFLMPPINTQKKIASILSAYDDLIENNLRRIRILEEMAQLIYREWFVKFRFPGHEKVKMVDSPLGKIPEGWVVVNLSEAFSALESGSRPKGGIDPSERGIPSIGAENILGLGKYDYSKEKYVGHDYYNGMRKGHILSGDVLLYKDGAKIGRKSMFRDGFPHETCCINEHVFILRTNDKCSQIYLYFWLDQPEMTQNIVNLNSNAAQPGINQKGVKGLPILLPTKEILKRAEEVLEPIVAEIFNLAKRNNILRQTRDLLLPKLISGQLDVSELDIDIGETAA